MTEEHKDDAISVELRYIRENVKDIKEKLNDSYVRKEEFEPIRKLVYGLVALILTSVVLAILGIVITT